MKEDPGIEVGTDMHLEPVVFDDSLECTGDR